jgi:hypothetical protein
MGTALLPGLAAAQSFTVVDGQTVGQQVMSGAGDIGIVDVGGAVQSNATPGIEMQAGDQRVENAGTIIVTGDAAGIYALADAQDAVIINTGSITSDGSGIVSLGAGGYLRNSGDIVTSGEYAAGMSAHGAGATQINEGLITVLGSEGNGIIAVGPSSLATNDGEIRVYGLAGIGIRVTGNDAQVANYGSIYANQISSTGISLIGSGTRGVNHGNIFAEGATSSGVVLAGADSLFENHGLIAATVDDADGARLFAYTNSHLLNYGTISSVNGVSVTALDGTEVQNFGTILSADGLAVDYRSATLTNAGTIQGATYAIRALGGNSTLNLLAGSVIEGKVEMFEGGNTVNFGPGLNAQLHFSGTLPGTITTSSNPYVISGNTVAVLDRGGFALTDDMLFSLADNAGAGVNGGARTCLDSDNGAECSVSAWLAGLGNLSTHEASDDLAAFRHWQGGLEAGLDITAGDISAGVFLSGVSAMGEIQSSQETEMSGGVFGGHVGISRDGVFADLSARLGLLDIASRRDVADNTVDGGLMTAEAENTALFISPQLTTGANIALGEHVLTPSATLRYTHLGLDGYAETGSTDTLTVDARTASELALRAQVALSLAPMLSDTGELVWTFRAGAEASHRDGDVTAALTGEEISFDTGSAGEALDGLVGASLDYRFGNGLSLSGDLEYAFDRAGSRDVSARASLSAAF